MTQTTLAISLSHNQQQVLVEVVPPLNETELSYLGSLGMVNLQQSIFQGHDRTSIIYDTDELKRKYAGYQLVVAFSQISDPFGTQFTRALSERRYPGHDAPVQSFQMPNPRW